MSTKKITQITQTDIVDHTTGEVKSSEHARVINIPREPSYIKLYLDDIEKLYDLPSNSSTIVYELLKELNYNGLIPLNSTTKKMICEKVGYKLQSLNNYLTDLVKKDVFRKAGRGVFKPNPHLFGKGDWKDIYKMREAWLKVSYKEDGSKDVTSSFDEEKNEEEQLDLLGSN